MVMERISLEFGTLLVLSCIHFSFWFRVRASYSLSHSSSLHPVTYIYTLRSLAVLLLRYTNKHELNQHTHRLTCNMWANKNERKCEPVYVYSTENEERERQKAWGRREIVADRIESDWKSPKFSCMPLSCLNTNLGWTERVYTQYWCTCMYVWTNTHTEQKCSRNSGQAYETRRVRVGFWYKRMEREGERERAEKGRSQMLCMFSISHTVASHELCTGPLTLPLTSSVVQVSWIFRRWVRRLIWESLRNSSHLSLSPTYILIYLFSAVF